MQFLTVTLKKKLDLKKIAYKQFSLRNCLYILQLITKKWQATLNKTKSKYRKIYFYSAV